MDVLVNLLILFARMVEHVLQRVNKYLPILKKKLVCTCPAGFYGSRCQYKKFCGYCSHTSCIDSGICQPCSTGLSGDQCQTTICTGMDATICLSHGNYFLYKGSCQKTGTTRACVDTPGWDAPYNRKMSCRNWGSQLNCNEKGENWIILRKLRGSKRSKRVWL